MGRKILFRKSTDSYLIGWGSECAFSAFSKTDFEALDQFIAENQNTHLFFNLSYELGFDLLEVTKNDKKRANLPIVQVWKPKIVAELKHDELNLIQGEPSEAFEHWIQPLLNEVRTETSNLDWNFLTSKEEYLKDIREIQNEIQLGNCYELNYCMRFEASGKLRTSSIDLFKQLDAATHAPHAFLYEDERVVVASASPERFIQKIGNKLISQPIKGTAKRGLTAEDDTNIARELQQSLKDKTENVMIVDLVRNDLSKVATKGSVNVKALNELHTFETVHQLISTVECEVKSEETFSSIIRALFPMGSMTGAPKKAAVQLSEMYERSARDWYSGSFGHIAPNGDFDSNVVIRTLFYDKAEEQFSCMVGGAITYLSEAEEEWEECKTKVGKILNLFGTCTW